MKTTTNKDFEFIIITNDSNLSKISADLGVRVMVDIERNGKHERQKNRDTLISHHEIDDLKTLTKKIPNGTFILRINPLCSSTREEINRGIEAGAHHIMLPMVRTEKEIEICLDYIQGRCSIIPLVENGEALMNLHKILKFKEIKEVHLGLNDLSLDLGIDFMFDLIDLGLVDFFCKTAKKNNKIFGFGGVSVVGDGALKSEDILFHHKRLSSKRVILSRSFVKKVYDPLREYDETLNLFKCELDKIKAYL